MTVLKNILKEKENESIGNLPIYKKDLKTSVAFHVLTNQIVVVEIKNHKLYSIDIEQINVITKKVNDPTLKEILFKYKQYPITKNPSSISIKPVGEILLNETQNWLSIGLSNT